MFDMFQSISHQINIMKLILKIVKQINIMNLILKIVKLYINKFISLSFQLKWPLVQLTPSFVILKDVMFSGSSKVERGPPSRFRLLVPFSSCWASSGCEVSEVAGSLLW